MLPSRQMLVVRQEQLDIFEKLSLRDCADFVRAFVLENVLAGLPPLPADVLDFRVTSGINRAVAHGLTTYSDIAIFVSLLFAIGPTFDSYPFFRSVLSDDDLDHDERLDVMVELAVQRDWQDAFETGGEAAWCRRD